MIITVDGISMSPTYTNQQRLLVRRGHRCRRNDVVVFTTANWNIPSVPAMLVAKRFAAVPGDKVPADMASILSDAYVPMGMIVVRGDNRNSLDSRRLGYVAVSAITGVVVRPLAMARGTKDCQ